MMFPLKMPLEHELALKAVAWDYTKGTFVSPSVASFSWSKDGLESAECVRGCDNEDIPTEHCSCGLYATYRLDTLIVYVNRSDISPLLLVEASGRTIVYEHGIRSYQLTVRAVMRWPEQLIRTARPDQKRLDAITAAQASDYFDVPIVDWEVGTMIMDLWNIKLNPDWQEWYQPETPQLRNASSEDIQKYILTLEGREVCQQSR